MGLDHSHKKRRPQLTDLVKEAKTLMADTTQNFNTKRKKEKKKQDETRREKHRPEQRNHNQIYYIANNVACLWDPRTCKRNKLPDHQNMQTKQQKTYRSVNIDDQTKKNANPNALKEAKQGVPRGTDRSEIQIRVRVCLYVRAAAPQTSETWRRFWALEQSLFIEGKALCDLLPGCTVWIPFLIGGGIPDLTAVV